MDHSSEILVPVEGCGSVDYVGAKYGCGVTLIALVCDGNLRYVGFHLPLLATIMTLHNDLVNVVELLWSNVQRKTHKPARWMELEREDSLTHIHHPHVRSSVSFGTGHLSEFTIALMFAD